MDLQVWADRGHGNRHLQAWKTESMDTGRLPYRYGEIEGMEAGI